MRCVQRACTAAFLRHGEANVVDASGRLGMKRQPAQARDRQPQGGGDVGGGRQQGEGGGGEAGGGGRGRANLPHWRWVRRKNRTRPGRRKGLSAPGGGARVWARARSRPAAFFFFLFSAQPRAGVRPAPLLRPPGTL